MAKIRWRKPRVNPFPDSCVFHRVSGGFAILGDGTDPKLVAKCVGWSGGKFPLIVADPPYGNIVDEKWDCIDTDAYVFAEWMLNWASHWKDALVQGGAFYIWGGVGTYGFRPFFKFLSRVEREVPLAIANLITWSKKRAYGVQNNYLFTREECVYLVNGNPKKPHKFNIPLLEEKRGYAGYNSKYPAKSEYLRRTNVWTDITEIFRGKVHPTQKQQRVMEIPIEVHTDPGDWVVDPFAGSGTTAHAARKLGRKFIVIEKDPKIYEEMVARLR